MDAAVKNLNAKEATLCEAVAWVEANKLAIPDCVYQAIGVLIALRLELEQTKQRTSKLLTSFRTLLGVIPKAERMPVTKPNSDTKQPKTDEEKLAALKARRAKLLAEIRRYEDRLGKGRRKGQKTSKRKSESPPQPTAEPIFQRAAETVFSGNWALPETETNKLAINKPENFENPRGLHSVSDKRKRYEYGVTTKKSVGISRLV